MSNDPKVHTYPGEHADVRWDGRLCIHVGECTRASGELFVGGREPWCEPDLADAEEVADVVARCPTGALTFTNKGNQPDESAPSINTITVSNNGPLYVRGNLDIEGAEDDMTGVRFRAALCRCGESQNKPFCDNSHEEAEFRDRGAIGESGPGTEIDGGQLNVKRAPNGPLLVSGNVTLITGSGREAWKGTKAALCRCGVSENKPFCDGSHRAAGFEAD
jgi:CDGSH-type Zn-finger protein/uncharacterized Fe-S cluster protein YjdI